MQEGAEEMTELRTKELVAEELAEKVKDDFLQVEPTALAENGWAVALGRTLADLDGELLAQVYRLSESGIAHLFVESGGLVLAMAGSTAGDRRRAVVRFSKTSNRPLATRRFFGVLIDAGVGDHYSEECGWGITHQDRQNPVGASEAAAERFKAARYYRPTLSGIGLDAGAIKRHVNPAPRALLAAVFRTSPDKALALFILARLAVSFFKQRLLRAGASWDSRAERERMISNAERIRQEIFTRRKRDEDLAVKTAQKLDAEREADSEKHWAEDERFRRHVERRRNSGRTAYDTARAVYLQRCPDLQHKLLHLLRRDGVQPEDEFLFRHSNLATETTDPQGTLRVALRQLADAGKVRRVRSSRTGEVFLTATEPLDETGYRRSLNALVRDGRFGIVNPWTKNCAVATTGDPGDWEEGLQELDGSEVQRLAPGRFHNTEVPEQPLLAAEQVADYSALEEVEAIAEGMA